jgi:CheY-like chemotaxis protein
LGDQLLLIAFTAYAWPEDRQHAYEAGFNVYLPKPADVGKLCRWLTPARL